MNSSASARVSLPPPIALINASFAFSLSPTGKTFSNEISVALVPTLINSLSLNSTAFSSEPKSVILCEQASKSLINSGYFSASIFIILSARKAGVTLNFLNFSLSFSKVDKSSNISLVVKTFVTSEFSIKLAGVISLRAI